MNPAQILDAFAARHIALWAEGGQLGFDAPAGALSPDDLALLRSHKPELLDHLEHPPAARWAELEAQRWGPALDDPVPADPGPTGATTFTSDDCPAWVDDPALSISLADVRASLEFEAGMRSGRPTVRES